MNICTLVLVVGIFVTYKVSLILRPIDPIGVVARTHVSIRTRAQPAAAHYRSWSRYLIHLSMPSFYNPMSPMTRASFPYAAYNEAFRTVRIRAMSVLQPSGPKFLTIMILPCTIPCIERADYQRTTGSIILLLYVSSAAI